MVALAGSVNGLGGLYPPNGKAITVLDDGAPARASCRKPWGHEIWWTETEQYAGKLLIVNVGHRLSLRFHREKDETSYLLSGRLRLLQGPSEDALVESEIGAGEAWRNEPGVVHSIEALEESVVLEVSTPHLDDVVRIRDHYGRADSS
jgi:mannose-6-phosphate isomerase